MAIHRISSVMLLASATLLISGCVTGAQFFQSPPGATFGAEYAELTFEPGKFGTGNIFKFWNQSYSAGEEGLPLAIVASHGRKETEVRSVLFPAGRKVVIVAGMSMRYGAPGVTASGSSSCVNQSSFTPLANMRYRIVQNGAAEGQCSLLVVDAATGREPFDLVRVRFNPDGTAAQ